MVTNPELWSRIEAFALDDGTAAFPFSRRLMMETGWGRAYALGAIQEYKRFLYLASLGRGPVTPSREVDAVWHLHMIYTRSYWERLCGEVLQQPLHHEPTPGGTDAGALYRVQYAATKALYRKEFGAEVPEAYWPGEAERFQSDLRQMRRGLAMPWRAAAAVLAGMVLFAAASLAMTGPALAAEGSDNTALYVSLGALAVGLLVVGFIVFAAASGGSATHGKRKDSSDGAPVYYGGEGGSGKGGKGDKGDADGDGGSDGGGGDGGGGGGCGGGCGS